jgi:hypothetical protein
MPRHNTAADKELTEDLPQELWAAKCVWVHCGSHVHWCSPSCPSTTASTLLCSAASTNSSCRWPTGRTTSQPSRHKPCTSRFTTPTAAPPLRSQPRRDMPTTAVLPKRIHFNLTPVSQPTVDDSETVCPGTPARFFACPVEASSSLYLQRNRGLPTWQLDSTIFAASRDQENRGGSVGAPCRGCLSTYSEHMSMCTVRIKSIYS